MEGVYTLHTKYERDESCPVCGPGTRVSLPPTATLESLLAELRAHPSLGGKSLIAPSLSRGAAVLFAAAGIYKAQTGGNLGKVWARTARACGGWNCSEPGDGPEWQHPQHRPGTAPATTCTSPTQTLGELLGGSGADLALNDKSLDAPVKVGRSVGRCSWPLFSTLNRCRWKGFTAPACMSRPKPPPGSKGSGTGTPLRTRRQQP